MSLCCISPSGIFSLYPEMRLPEAMSRNNSAWGFILLRCAAGAQQGLRVMWQNVNGWLASFILRLLNFTWIITGCLSFPIKETNHHIERHFESYAKNSKKIWLIIMRIWQILCIIMEMPSAGGISLRTDRSGTFCLLAPISTSAVALFHCSAVLACLSCFFRMDYSCM